MISVTERKIFASDEDFIICNISDADRSNYVELHRQLNGKASLYLNPISKDMMWKQILDNADSVFSLFTGNGEYCGSIELQQPNSNTPEIGIDLLAEKRNQKIAPKAVRLFARRVYEIRKVDCFLIRISSKNQHSIHVFEKMGAVKIGEEETAFSRFREKFRKTAEEGGLDLEKFRHLFRESADEIVYCYSLNPDTFLHLQRL
ncbi:Uncharacterised protein [uncultured Roseburia sp.]|nr:Uncharacterised protein [uncultured Roseburia sp.]